MTKGFEMEFEAETLELLVSVLDRKWYLTAPDNSHLIDRDDHTIVDHYVNEGRFRGLTLTPLVDERFYLEQVGDREDVAPKSGDFFIEHFVSTGFGHEIRPHPLFEATWYYREAQRDSEKGINPLLHYLRIGWRRNHWPHPLFDPRHYVEECSKSGIEVDGPPLSHYLRVGAAQGISPHLLFDPAHYREQLISRGSDPAQASLTHFVQVGEAELINPHPLFDVAYYKAQEPTGGRRNSLVSFICDGQRLRYSPHPLIDTKWYLERNKEAEAAWKNGIDPITHYIREGSRLGLSTSPFFDPRWYGMLWARPDQLEPLLCTIVRNRSQGVQRISQDYLYDAEARSIVYAPRIYKDSSYPLVSVIIVNFNGSCHLPDLYSSLALQTYGNFEVIFVDNASSDQSVAIAESLEPKTKIVRLAHNEGFAKANNIGIANCRGELIVLLNNDTKVDVNWLEEMVACMKRHDAAAIVTPRVRFWTKFREIRITSRESFTVDFDRVLASLSYKKCILNRGSARDGGVVSEELETRNEVVLKVPFQEVNIDVHLRGTNPNQRCRIQIGDGYPMIVTPSQCGVTTYLDVSAAPGEMARYVINNAGSCEPSWLDTCDIGFGEFDDGQYGIERKVDLACGCAMMVRRSALGRDLLFYDEFVAYYEDSELSRRLRRAGNTIVYCPSAIVYHRHSSTSAERSAFWWKYVTRNKAVYRYLFSPPDHRHAFLHDEMLRLNHYFHWLGRQDILTREERHMKELLPEIMLELKELCQRIDLKSLSLPTVPKVGIFNRWWKTRGGGEAHALRFAAYLGKYLDVELISETDFDLEAITGYFSIDHTPFRKSLTTRLNTDFTRNYDIFINTSYQDETPSGATHSFYIVSFPSSSPSREFLSSYIFLANSEYTKRWMSKFYGRSPIVHLVEPSVSARLTPSELPSKKQTILSVGRFFSGGHCKRQVEIIQCFKLAGMYDWTLKLAGSVGDPEYYDQVQSVAAGLNVELYPDASLDTVQALFKEATIYLHAAGLGQDVDKNPENFEHFGMSVAEACINGCFPIVFDHAGPADIIDRLGQGLKYRDLSTMVAALQKAIDLADKGRLPLRDVYEAAQIYTAGAGEGRMKEVFQGIVG